MSITPSDLFFAGDALQPEGNEAFDRSATSRYYYSVHHATKVYLSRAHGITDLSPRELNGRFRPTHAVVVDLLETVNPVAADILDDLLTRRVRADYDLDASWAAGERQQARAMAQQLRRLYGVV